MKVLWFTNCLEPGMAKKLGSHAGVSGGWMWALAQRLRRQSEITLAVATAVPGAKQACLRHEDVTHYVIPQPRSQNPLSHTAADLRRACDVVRHFRPDIIHVHGTERFFGLVSQMIEPPIPVVVSIQGLLSVYRPFVFADMTPSEKLAMVRLRDLVRARGIIFELPHRRNAVRREERMLATNRYFIGRTEWDRSWVMAHNPSAKYYVCDEMLRDPFYEEQWDISRVRRNTVLFTSAQNPLKGVYTLLEAIAILRRWRVPVTLQLAGDWLPRSELGRPVAQRVSRLGLNGSVEFLGPINSSALAKHMSTAHIFVSPSHIDNASNSIMEAMAVGLPCVSSYIGGVTTTLNNGQLGIMTPPGDAAMLASAIQRLLSDDGMAVSLSRCARDVAHQRYDPATLTERQVRIYSDIIHDAACNSQES